MTMRDAIPVVLIEDDVALGEAVAQALRLEGHAVTLLGNAHAALELLDADFPGVVVSDVRLPGLDGLAFFAQLRQLDADLPVVFTTGHGDVPMAVEVLKQGAADFFTKPYAVADVVRAIALAAEKRSLVIENRRLRAALGAQAAGQILGTSQAAERLRSIVAAVAESDIDVVLEGAPGTGKSFTARLLHDLGPRARRPFVAVDPGLTAHQDADILLFGREPSAGLSRTGLIERANGGTLFLDKLSAMPPAIEARLVSLLETRAVLPLGAERARKLDLRIVVASGLAEGEGDAILPAIEQRLGAVRITLPTLDARREDLAEIFRHFVIEQEKELDKPARAIGESEWRYVLSHGWPGNFHELRAFARAFVLGLSGMDGSSDSAASDRSLQAIMADFERTVLENALRRSNGHVGKLSKLLQTPRKTLYDKLARYDLKSRDYRRGG